MACASCRLGWSWNLAVCASLAIGAVTVGGWPAVALGALTIDRAIDVAIGFGDLDHDGDDHEDE